MRYHLRQTTYAFFAITAFAAVLYVGVGASLKTEASTQVVSREYSGTTPLLPEVSQKPRFVMLQKNEAEEEVSIQTETLRVPYLITSVIDGNTLVADGRIRIRLAGIKAPEKDEELGIEATDFLKDLVKDQEVLFMPDGKNPKDAYGRLRGVIYLKSTNINIEMLKNGYAQVYPVYPSSIDTESWIEYSRIAKEGQKGLWGDVTQITPDTETTVTDPIDTE